MSHLRILALALLACGLMLPRVDAHAQARGPSAREVHENGQEIGTSVPEWAPYLDQLARQSGMTPADVESSEIYWTAEEGFVLVHDDLRFALGKLGPPAPPPLDTTSRIRKNEEQQAWLSRLVGRFRLGGRVESRYNLPIVDPNNPLILTYVFTTSGGDISGIADCAAVGKGPGVHCILNASWPTVELGVASIGDPPPRSEGLKVFQPAVAVFGINPDTAEISANMVTDDSTAHTWAGRLEDNALIARRLNDCVDPRNLPENWARRCLQPLEISAQPDGTMTIVLTYLGVTIKLSLQRDPAARVEKARKVR